ncbi:MAG: chromosome segregation protein SMC [Planctomycetota bacterium]
MRKLERTEQNLLRVADIIEEVERRLRSVKLQAGKARNYQAYDARLRELRSVHALAEYHRLTLEMESRRRDAQAGSDAVTKLRTRIDVNEAESVQLSSEADRLSAELSEVENHHLQVQSQITAHEERVDAAARRLVEEEEHLARSQERLDVQRQRRETLAAELARLQNQAEQLERRIGQQNATIEQLLGEDHTLSGELTRAQALLEDEKAGLIELVRRTAELHNEIAKLETHRDALEGQRGRLSQRDAQITGELRELLQRKSELEPRQAEIETLIETEMQRLEEKKREAARLQGMQADLAGALTEARELRSGLASRKQLLSDLEQKMEGVGEGVRQLLADKVELSDEPALACIQGMVADLFEAELLHALVVEAAVGDQDQYLVVGDTPAFLSDPSRFERLAGRLTAICLDRLPPVINVRDFSAYPGFVAPVLDFVSFPDPLERLGRHLLGKTIVVESLESGLAMAGDDTDGHRFVTLSGQVVEPDGRISLGPPASQAGLISRKSELRDIDQQLVELERQIAVLTDQVSRTETEAAHLDQVQQELRGAIHDCHTARVEVSASLANVNEAVRRLTDEQPLVAGEVALIERQIAEAQAGSTQTRESLERMEEENLRREQQVAVHQRRIDEVVSDRTRLQERLTEARVSAGQLAEKRSATADTLLGLRRELYAVDAAEAEAAGETEQCRRRIAEAEETILAGREQLTWLCLTSQRQQADAMSLRRRREMVRFETEELSVATKSSRVELEEVETDLHAAQMALQEATVRRDELWARVRDEIDIDLARQYESYDHAERNWDEVEAEITELRGKIERLGNVNLDAITELEELEARYQFLTTQRDDLHKSQAQLEQLIKQLDAESVQRFTEAFEQIRSNFRELFRKLFGGGKADIVLEDPDEILECGIEILARPPGKELQSITLMSGGEKTLTAIALLMSVFQSRPAPFALLDEVDAALDEANNDRFNRILLEFVEQSQFIIITHAKRTMTVADQMYGITMQEPGISTRVSVKFEPAQERDTSAVA